MKKKKDPTASMRKEELQKQLKKKSSAVERMKRELKIEASLEQVRARTVSMQKSEELAETASVLFKQLLGLGIRSTQMRTCAIVTLKSDEPIGECWITKPDGDIIPQSFMVPYDETSAYKTIYAAWKNGEKFLVVHLSGDALVQHLNFLKKYAKIPTQQFQALPDQPKETFTHAMFFSQGYLFIISNEPLPEYHDIFRRFGSVFQQTYTRFLDLQKAEAQARQALIELALERVRARTMAMHKSEEFMEVINLVSEQLQLLNITIHIAGFSLDYKAHPFNIWMAAPGQPYPSNIDVPYREIPMMQRIKGAIDKGLDFYADTFSFEEKNQWLDNVLENTIIKYATEERKKFMLTAIGLSITIVMQQQIALMMGNYAAIPYTD